MKGFKKTSLFVLCLLMSYFVFSQKIKRGEYFIDTDPGIGYGIPIPAFTNFNDSTLNFSVNTTTLSPGSHYLFARFCNTNNVWSQYEGRHFYIYIIPVALISPSIVAAEYFFDTDPGIGNAIPFPNFSPFSNTTLTLSPNTSTLVAGSHYLFTRFKDASGKWSQYEGRHLYLYSAPAPAVSPSVVAGEYFFDSDPGFGNGTPIASFPAFSSSTLNLLASSTSSFSGGTHNLFSRFKDASGIWGHYEGRSFTVCAVVPSAQFNVNNGCVGSAITITNTSINAASFAWDINNDGSTDYTTSGNVAHTYTLAGSYTIKLTTTSSSSCTSTQTTVVVIASQPIIGVNSGSVCSGHSFTISPSGANTYTVNGSNLVVSPSITTSYSITGTSSAGCVSSVAAVSNVTVSASPTVAASSGSMCSGKSFTIIPSGANTYTINGSGSNFTVSPNATATYSVVGSSTAGCISTNTAISNITVYNTPTITVTSGSICSGNSFIITPTGANAYTINGSGSNFSVSPISTTTYSVIGISAQGCVSSNTAISTITVLARPVIAINSATICSGNPAILTPTALGISVFNITGGNFTVTPNTSTSYSVTGTGTNGCASSNTAVASVSVNTTPTVSVISSSICSGMSAVIAPTGAANYTITGGNFTVSPNVTSTYSVTGTSAQGCISSNTAVSNITVYTTPSITVNNGSICSGDSFIITPSGANTYSINGNNFNVSPIVTTTYSVMGTSTEGCVSTIAAISQVTVYTTPTVSASNGSVCLGNSFAIIPSGANTYTLNGTSSNFTVNPTLNTSYSVTGTSVEGCLSSNTVILTVTVISLPTIIVNSGSICSGGVFTLMPTGAISYTFSSGSATVSPTSNTTYTINGTNASGCVNSNVAISSVNVLPLPILNVIGASNPLCIGESTSFSVSGASSYNWSTGETNASIAVSPTLTTTYTVTGKDANGCENVATITQSVEACTGLEKQADNEEIKVYPNPNNGEFIIETAKISSVSILNSIGQVIKEEHLHEGKNRINLNEVTKGIYFIEINDGSKKYTQKLVFQ